MLLGAALSVNGGLLAHSERCVSNAGQSIRRRGASQRRRVFRIELLHPTKTNQAMVVGNILDYSGVLRLADYPHYRGFSHRSQLYRGLGELPQGRDAAFVPFRDAVRVRRIDLRSWDSLYRFFH